MVWWGPSGTNAVLCELHRPIPSCKCKQYWEESCLHCKFRNVLLSNNLLFQAYIYSSVFHSHVHLIHAWNSLIFQNICDNINKEMMRSLGVLSQHIHSQGFIKFQREISWEILLCISCLIFLAACFLFMHFLYESSFFMCKSFFFVV